MPTASLTKRKLWTDAALEALPRDGKKYELLQSELIMSPVHANHGLICMRLGSLLFSFVERHQFGQVFDSSTGFRLSQATVLSPDLAFVSKSRLAKLWVGPDEFLNGAPDLAVEVLSPSDRMRELHRKLDLYFERGTRLAWVVNWKIEQVHIYRPDSIHALTRPAEMLAGEDVIPGFKCRLSRLFGSA